MDDLISRKWLMECVDEGWIKFDTEKDTNTYIHLVRDIAPSAQPKSYREGYQAGFKDAQPECAKDFVMLKVIDLNGRPYYSIIYLEDGCEYEGYSSYDLKVISEYLKRYFGFEQPEIIRCRDCKHWVDNDGFNHDKGAECEVMRMWMQPGDYCSYAKKREVSDGNTN